jgi:hypothetical protein
MLVIFDAIFDVHLSLFFLPGPLGLRLTLDGDDGENEPHYWLGYASGPRTDQHPPSLHARKRAGKTNLGESSGCSPVSNAG